MTKKTIVLTLIDSVFNAPDIDDWDYNYVIPPEITEAVKNIPIDIQEEVAKEFYNKVSNPKTNKFYRDDVRIQLNILTDITNKTIDKYYQPISTIILNEKEIKNGVELICNGSRYWYRGHSSFERFDNNGFKELAYHLESYDGTSFVIAKANDLVSKANRKAFK